MSSYTYTKLKTEEEEIRLIRLMPGEPGDDISFSIFHATLIPLEAEIKPRGLPIEDL
jgi:hypothetical protein